MRTVQVSCEGERCKLIGETSNGYYTVDYVFAVDPSFVRYGADGSIDFQFDPPVECQDHVDLDTGVKFIYCAANPLPVRLEFVNDGKPYLVEE